MPAIRGMSYFLLARIFWRCLWRTFVQITRTTPARRTTLQFSQIRLTLVRTFMSAEPRS
jgi:hypothetical protein